MSSFFGELCQVIWGGGGRGDFVSSVLGNFIRSFFGGNFVGFICVWGTL